MSTRSVIVRLEAEVSPYITALGKAEKATSNAAKTIEAAGKAQQEQGRSASSAAKDLDAAADAAGRAGEAAKKAAPATEQATLSIEEQAAAAQEAAAALGLQYDATGRLVDSNEKLLSSAQASAVGMEGFSDAVYLNGRTAAEASDAAASSAQDATAAAEEQANAAVDVGEAMAVFGSATVAALGLAAKAAMDWESAWAGVTKTVDGTPEQMAELEQGLRGLALVLPATHEEIAGVAEAAGQLGVARKDVVGFTKTMIDLSETTNLTADDAATAIAQISNVMGTMARDGSIGVEKFGSALVALGNAGASTESEILDMSQRLAGAGKLIGASESDVLAMANAMASVGIKAELGGGVMTRVMTRMYADVQNGGEGLQTLAKIAGVSSQEFSDAFKNDPVRAIDMMVKGLGRVKESGGNVIQTMKDIGIKGTEETSVILSLTGAGDLLTESLDLGAKAWDENSALAEEAGKRYETTESKVQVAWNNIKDATIDAGAVVLPAISEMADGASDLAKMFGDLPEPVQTALIIIAGVVGVAAVAGGAFLTLLPKVQAINASLIAMGPAGAAASAGLLRVGKIAGGAIIALGAFMVAAEAAGSGMDKIGTSSEFETAMHQMSEDAGMGSDALDSLMTVVGSSLTEINGLADALGTVNMNGFLKGLDWVGSVGGIFDSELGLASGALKNFDSSLSKLATGGNFELAAAGFKKAVEAGKEQNLTIEQVAESFPQYKEALQAAAIEQGGFAAGADLMQLMMGEIPPKIKAAGDAAATAAAQEQVAAQMSEDLAKELEDVGVAADGSIGDIQKFAEVLFGTGLAVMSSRDATFKWKDTLRDMAPEIQAIIDSQVNLGAILNENATDFNTTTDAGKNANTMFQDIVRQGLDVAKTFSGDVTKSQQDVQAQLTSTYDAGVQSAIGLGLSEDAAVALTREVLHIPPGVNISTWMADEAKRMAEQTKAAIDNIPGSKNIDVHVRTMFEEYGTPYSNDVAAAAPGAPGNAFPLKKAKGGGIYGGTPGKDSVPLLGMPGEHMLTTADVDALGGQAGVYAFRASLHAGGPALPAYATGGPSAASSAPASSYGGGLDTAALDRLTDAVRSARQITVQQMSTTHAQTVATAREMEGF